MCFFFKCLCSCKENLRKFLPCKWKLFENFNAGAVSQRKRKKSSTSRFFFHLHLVGFFIVTITNSSSQSNTTTTTSSSWHFNLQQCSKHCSLVVPTALRPGPYYIISVFMRVIHITCVCVRVCVSVPLFLIRSSRFTHHSPISKTTIWYVWISALSLFFVCEKIKENSEKYKKYWRKEMSQNQAESKSKPRKKWISVIKLTTTKHI